MPKKYFALIEQDHDTTIPWEDDVRVIISELGCGFFGEEIFRFKIEFLKAQGQECDFI